MPWLNLTMPNQTVKNSLKAIKIKLPQKNFFSRKTTDKIFLYLLAPFILQNFKTNLTADPELCAIFRSKMTHLSWTKFFWYKPLLLLSSTYWPFSLCKILKKILTVDPELWGCTIFGPKIAHFPKWEFFQKTC